MPPPFHRHAGPERPTKPVADSKSGKHGDAGQPGPATVVCLKAFGDFVIACRAVRRVQGPSRSGAPRILAGAHLRVLAQALGVRENVAFVNTGSEQDVPAAFDIRRRGWVGAARSLLQMRSALTAARGDARLVFDRLGWRERIIAGSADSVGLPIATNIYSAYECLLSNAGYEIAAPAPASNGALRSAIIVPASRIGAKTLPAETIRSVLEQLAALGIQAEVILLEGDVVQMPPGMQARRISRTFEALIDRVRRSDLVVSADSLAAHLAEYLGRRSFVVAPRANIYWLPADSLRSEGWTTFDRTTRLSSWLAGVLLERPTPGIASDGPGPQG